MKKHPIQTILSVIALMASFSYAVDAPTGCEMPQKLETVTEDDVVYHKIGSCGDLYKFAEMVNNGSVEINGKLTADIVVNPADNGASVVSRVSAKLTAKGNPDDLKLKFWTPIGSYAYNYLGTFDGNGKTISGLYFNYDSQKMLVCLDTLA